VTDRTVPTTVKADERSCATQWAAMKPLAPVTRTVPCEIEGIFER
jgi:hypothetical protein